jgi:hypothetical protein
VFDVLARQLSRGLSRPLFRALSGIIDTFNPLSLFRNGEQGGWYDPSDLSTLFQDSAGTIPVTSDGDPVGLILDKSGRGNHASQSVSASRPTYKTDGSMYWLNFDGVDDFMYVPSINYANSIAYIGCIGATYANKINFSLGSSAGANKIGSTSSGSFIRVETSGGSLFTTSLSGNNIMSFGRESSSTQFGRVNAAGVSVASTSSSSNWNLLGKTSDEQELEGRVYALVISETYAADRLLLTEQYIAGKTGVTL